MRRRLRFLVAALCALVAVAAGASLVVLRLGRPLYYTDGSSLTRADLLADRPMQVFDRPMPAFEIPGPVRGRIATLPDGRVIYGRAHDASRTTLVVFDPERRDVEPVALAIGSSGHDFAACLDEHGDLWFASDRDGGAGGFDLWRAASLGDGGFAAPTPLPATVNTPADEVDPAIASDGTTLVFARRVPDEKRTQLFVASLDTDVPARTLWPGDDRDPFAKLSLVLDREPAFARDGTFLFFVREETGRGKRVLGVPRHGATFGDALEEPALSEGGRFSSPAPLASARGDGFSLRLLGGGDAPLVYDAQARLLRPWWEGQRDLERLLAWLLAIAVLLLALLLLGARWRALDIVTWCILVSLLVHFLLWWLLEDVIMSLRDPKQRGEGERIAITMIDGTTADAADAAASGDRVAQALRAVRADRAEAATADAPGAALAAAESAPRPLDDLARVVPESGAAVPDTTNHAMQDEAQPIAPAAGSDALPASDVALAASPATARASQDTTRDAASRATDTLRVTAPAASGPLASEPARASSASFVAEAVPHATPDGRGESAPTPSLHDAVASAVPAAASDASLPALLATGTSLGTPARPAPTAESRREASQSGPDPLAVKAPGPAAAELPASAPRATEPLADLARAPAASPPPRPPVSGAVLRDALPAATEIATPAGRPGTGLALSAALAAPADIAPRAVAPSAERALQQAPSPVGEAPRAVTASSALPKPSAAASQVAQEGERTPSPSRTAMRAPRLADAVPAPVKGSTGEPKTTAALGAAPLAALAPRATDLNSPSRRAMGIDAQREPSRPTAPSSRLPAPPRTTRPVLESAPRTDLAGLYGNRFGPQKAAAIERFGGSTETERAVANGLAYLASIQDPRGHWGRKSFDHAKYGEVWVGKTALCALAFLGAGHTPRSNSQYSAIVDRAVEALLDAQDEGSAHFGDTSSYSHGIATYALAECLAISGDARLREPVQRAILWILRNQNATRDRRNRGGWGYFSGTLTPEDHHARTSVTVWQVMALESAKLSGIEVPDAALAQARTFLRGMFDARGGFFYYTRDPSRIDSQWPTLPASTPGAVFSLLLLGDPVEDERLQAGLRYTLQRRPRAWRNASDDAFVLRAEGHPYFWYCGTLACFLAGGDAWREWNEALKEVFLPAQNQDGSFTPIGAYAEYADDRPDHAAFTTALAVLSLEAYYRYVTPLLAPR